MTQSKTILGNQLGDYSFLVFPGLIGIIVYSILGDNPALALFTSLFLDSGHVYSTLWKLNIKDVLNNSKVIIGFLVIAIGFSIWIFFELPFLWSFVTYATLYHHVRQCYGMGRWLDPNGLKIDKFFQYLFIL